jgi:hypothetical protein
MVVARHRVHRLRLIFVRRPLYRLPFPISNFRLSHPEFLIWHSLDFPLLRPATQFPPGRPIFCKIYHYRAVLPRCFRSRVLARIYCSMGPVWRFCAITYELIDELEIQTTQITVLLLLRHSANT